MRLKNRKYIFIISLLSVVGSFLFAAPSPQQGGIGSSAQGREAIRIDSASSSGDTLATNLQGTTIDTPVVAAKVRKPFLDEKISGSTKDSIVYDVKNKTVYLYEKGDVLYQDKNLKADFMRINMDNKEIFAHGREDTIAEKPTRAEFIDGGSTYTMDTITYNLTTEKARIKGVSTKDGEGILTGERVKKLADNTINIAHGQFTTCDAECPHFYLEMTRAKTIPGKKVIMGPSYMVLEDVPIPFLGLPFGFFPMPSEKNSGFIVPQYGEEMVKGFFIRNGGYYYAFNDYLDAALTAGIYTMGSWEAELASRYTKRYRYNGGINIRFSKDIMGDKGSPDYVNQNNFKIGWTHAQSPKFRPNSTFSASVNFSTSGYNKYGAQSMNDYLNTQTNSSVSYSKTWAGKPFSFSTNFQHSQNSHDTTVSLSFPNAVFNISRIFPFKRKELVGKERWYEKIALQYTGTLSNNVTTKEKDLFTDKMLKQMKNGVNHVIPVSMSMNLFNYINISPSFNYQERWYFQKIDKNWDAAQKMVVSDTSSGFYRVYNYSFSVGASSKVYGTYQFKKGSPVEAIRHMLTPSMSFSYTPDFGTSKYGYYKEVQSDTLGTMTRYSPFQNGLYGVPGSGQSAAIVFSLQQTLEMKVRSKTDTSGIKKVKLIDNFGISSSYNLLADSLGLAPFALTLRTNLLQKVALNVTATLDPYQVNSKGQRINKFMLSQGKLGRLTNVSTSFGYSFNSSAKGNNRTVANDINSINSVPSAYLSTPEEQEINQMDANTRRQLLSSQYYDFDIPWNFGFNYSFSYTNNGVRSNITQTLGFNGSVNLTPKWGVSFNGGYDFQEKTLTPGTFNLTRNLHCWQMNFSWVPIGFRKSWSFSISVNSGMLKDLKYDRNSSFYDNLYDN